MRYLTTILILTCLANISIAGLDADSPYDDTIAVYYFNNNRDSGPRGFHLNFGGNSELAGGNDEITAQISDKGRIGKGLQLTDTGCLCGYYEDESLSIVGAEFSIVAWVKMRKQKYQFSMSAEGWGSEDSEHRVGMVSLTVHTDGNLIGTLERGLARANMSTNAWDDTQQDVANNRWHHIAFTQYANYLNLFVDGKLVKREKFDSYLGFIGNSALIRVHYHGKIKGSIMMDDLGFFETGFSPYEIKALRNSKRGLKAFLEVMPIDPADKMATTWGSMKSHRQ